MEVHLRKHKGKLFHINDYVMVVGVRRRVSSPGYTKLPPTTFTRERGFGA